MWQRQGLPSARSPCPAPGEECSGSGRPTRHSSLHGEHEEGEDGSDVARQVKNMKCAGVEAKKPQLQPVHQEKPGHLVDVIRWIEQEDGLSMVRRPVQPSPIV